MLLILQNLKTSKSYEITWIYNRSDGYYLLIEVPSCDLQVGTRISLAKYAPKLEKKINSVIVKIEVNPINSNVYAVLKDKRHMTFFKQSLIENKENKR